MGNKVPSNPLQPATLDLVTALVEEQLKAAAARGAQLSNEDARECDSWIRGQTLSTGSAFAISVPWPWPEVNDHKAHLSGKTDADLVGKFG